SPIHSPWNALVLGRRRNSDAPQQHHNTGRMQMVAKAPTESLPNEPTVKEGIKVAIHPEYPEQTVTIGESLSKK
ncbi:hypothetical protein Tco_0333979, partial [Tanacetum coccineum]